jgi:DnaK suppressor protein
MGLNKADRERMREILEGLLLDAEDQGFQPLEPNRVDDHGGRDNDGQPLNEMNQAIASNRNRVAGRSLERIEEALETLREHPGEFGLCEECDQPIPFGRLELMPHVRHCVPCQSALEEPTTGIRRRRVTDHV